MFNRERTLEEFGYDIDISKRRRTNVEVAANSNKKKIKVIDNCPSCGIERTITLGESRKNRICYRCVGKLDHVIEARRNQKHEASEETKAKMRASHWSRRGKTPHNKGIEESEEFKKIVSDAVRSWNAKRDPNDRREAAIKASCTLRNISREEFEYLTTENQLIRGSKEYRDFEKKVLDRDKKCQYPTCTCRNKKNLTIHHKDGFHWCIDKRFLPDNGVVLCKRHHKEFHSIYTTRNNTEEQFNTWIKFAVASFGDRLKLIVLGGPSGSGKTWVSEQLGELVSYVSFDKTPKEQHIMSIMQKNSMFPGRAVLYDPVRKSSTVFKRYSQVWDVIYVVIVEPVEVVVERIKNRGGIPNISKIQHSVSRHIKNSKIANFSGTSLEVLQYLRSILSQ